MEKGNAVLIAQVTKFKSEYGYQWPSGKKGNLTEQQATNGPELEQIRRRDTKLKTAERV
jgi:hypothetical protein